MSEKSVPRILAPKVARKKRHGPPHPATAQNTALTAQNRRVMAQHYRAKYGVK